MLLVGQPVHADSTPGNDVVVSINEIYSELAGGSDVVFVDADAAVENPDGSFASVLPEEPLEIVPV